MRTLLLDTNIVSYLMKESPRAKLYEPHLRDSRLAISFVTVGELYRWAIVRQWGTKRKLDLEEQLRNYLVNQLRRCVSAESLLRRDSDRVSTGAAAAEIFGSDANEFLLRPA
jgi:predicted nucleic acid-binding protein